MSRTLAIAAVPLAALPASPDAVPAAPLMLTCAGVATNPVGDPSRSHGGRTAGRKGRSSDTRAGDDSPADGSRPAATARGTPVEFRFEFVGDAGRVLYPATIVPVVHSGGHGGWWPVRDLAVSDAAFSGHIALNFINHARFTIDRHSGAFSLTGLQANVAGRCAKAEPGPRLF